MNIKNTNALDDPGTLIITDKEARHRMGNIRDRQKEGFYSPD